jgi:hypothetical protein
VLKRAMLIAAVAMLALAAPVTADGGRLERVSVGPSGGNGNTDAHFLGPAGLNGIQSSGAWWLANPLNEGTSAYFVTSERLVPEDTDNLRDLYRRKDGHTELVSTGPVTSGPQFDYCQPSLPPFDTEICPLALSRDGEHALFATRETLVPEDADGGYGDLYDRSGGQTKLISIGPEGGSGAFGLCDGSFPGSCSFATSAQGDLAVFWTAEPLVPGYVPGDPGNCPMCPDPYDRSIAGVTRLLRPPSLGASFSVGGPFNVSVDARHVFYGVYFGYRPHILVDSRDGYTLGISGSADAQFKGASADGTRVFFTSPAALTPDSSLPGGVYEKIDNNELRRLPLGPPSSPYDTGPFNSLGPVQVAGPSWDGSHLFFYTRSQLAPADTDDRWDLYSYSDRGIELVSTGPAGGNGPYDICQTGNENCLDAVSRDGTKVYFGSRESLTADDHDAGCYERTGPANGPCTDVYVRDLTAGTTRLVTTGPGLDDGQHLDFISMRFDAISADGSRAFFRTQMSLVPQDTDGGQLDLYERFAGRTRLLSTGPGVHPGESNVPTFGGSTADGRLVYFNTAAGLLPDDTDQRQDVYSVEVNEPPDCDAVTVSRPVLTTVNRRLVPLTLDGATDVDGDPTTLAIDGVTQDEPVTGPGDPTSPDAIDDGDGQVRVRAERNPHGDGRVYRIAFKATDDHGGTCTGTVTVSVPRKKHKPAVDSAPPSYDSFGR